MRGSFPLPLYIEKWACINEVLWGERVGGPAELLRLRRCSINFFRQKGHVDNTFLIYKGCYLMVFEIS